MSLTKFCQAPPAFMECKQQFYRSSTSLHMLLCNVNSTCQSFAVFSSSQEESLLAELLPAFTNICGIKYSLFKSLLAFISLYRMQTAFPNFHQPSPTPDTCACRTSTHLHKPLQTTNCDRRCHTRLHQPSKDKIESLANPLPSPPTLWAMQTVLQTSASLHKQFGRTRSAHAELLTVFNCLSYTTIHKSLHDYNYPCWSSTILHQPLQDEMCTLRNPASTNLPLRDASACRNSTSLHMQLIP